METPSSSVAAWVADHIIETVPIKLATPSFDPTELPLRPTSSFSPNRLHDDFLACPEPTLYCRHRMTGTYFICRIHEDSANTNNTTVTVVWEDGSWQMFTHPTELKRPTAQHGQELETIIQKERQMQIKQKALYESTSFETLLGKDIDTLRTSAYLLAKPSFTSIAAWNDSSPSHNLGRSMLDVIFLSCPEPTLFGQYQHSGQWFLCRIRSLDHDGTYTVAWEDGSIQSGTTTCRLRQIADEHREWIEKALSEESTRLELARLEEEDESKLIVSKSQQSPEPHSHSSTHVASQQSIPAHEDPSTTTAGKCKLETDISQLSDETTVWEAAKLGDMKTCLEIIDRGEATANDVELLHHGRHMPDAKLATEGRTPLYWACFGGHVELVRELLLRGGVDADGSAYLAVTSREKADDERDLVFNPDDNIFSDFVDYEDVNENENENAKVADSIGKSSEVVGTGKNENSNDVALIRAMLVAAQSSTNKKTTNMLPKQLYESTSDTNRLGNDAPHEEEKAKDCSNHLCIVCMDTPANGIPTPCGHVACCVSCLKKIRNRRDGCPICRGRIRVILARTATTVSSSS